jgi:hypothetical protein
MLLVGAACARRKRIVVNVRTAQKGRACFRAERDIAFEDDGPAAVDSGRDVDNAAAGAGAGIDGRVDACRVEGFAIAFRPILPWIEDRCAIPVRLRGRNCCHGNDSRSRAQCGQELSTIDVDHFYPSANQL